MEWNVNTDEWYDIACRAAGRNRTRAEWEEIGPRDAAPEIRPIFSSRRLLYAVAI